MHIPNILGWVQILDIESVPIMYILKNDGTT